MTLQPNQIAVLKACTQRGSIAPSDAAALIRFNDGLTVYAGFELDPSKASSCVIHEVESAQDFKAWCADHGLRLTGIGIDTRMFVVEPGSENAAFALKMRWG